MQEVGRYSTTDMAVDFLTVIGVREHLLLLVRRGVELPWGHALLVRFAAAPGAESTPLRLATRCVLGGHSIGADAHHSGRYFDWDHEDETPACPHRRLMPAFGGAAQTLS